MLTLFHDKKYCNCINLFPCILWDFTVLGLVLSWWRIKYAMKISAVSPLACKKFANKGSCEKVTWEAQARSWRVKCQVAFCKYFARKAISWGTCKILCLEVLSVTFHIFYPTIYTLITHKSKKRLIKENPREVSTKHPPFRERVIHPLVRNHYSLFSFPLPLSYLERRFVPKHNPHQFRV